MASERIIAQSDISPATDAVDLSDKDTEDLFNRLLPKEAIPSELQDALTAGVLEKVRKVDWENGSQDLSLEEILANID